MTIIYPYLPLGRQFRYVPSTDPFMAETERVARECSTDKYHPTGAVIVKDGQILGRGANQSTFRNPWILAMHRKYFCIRKLLKIKTGTKYWLCPGCAQYRHHAERLAIKEAQAKHGDITGADLYHWGHWWCCQPCWDAMIAAGIRDVYLLEGSERLFK